MRVWTEEQRQKQREAIRKWAPWRRSTGPRTAQGKRTSSMNALKHGMRSRPWRNLRHALYTQRLYVNWVQRNLDFIKKARRSELRAHKINKMKSRANELYANASLYGDRSASRARFYDRSPPFPSIKEGYKE
ncbi:MAG: hypothetical protein KDJ50_03410 [Alphaproteobacteria bacterium]|nr:hypothetical protein [Alphaproteobacteria bacterium]